MSYDGQAQAALREAQKLEYTHPWPMILLLGKAVTMALLAIAVAIEAASPGR